MELEELEKRLIPFSRFHYRDETAEVVDVFRMPGHAGFSYGFSVRQVDNFDKWYIPVSYTHLTLPTILLV